MELSFRMSRKEVRALLREQAKDFNRKIREVARIKQANDTSKKLVINKYYIVKSMALLSYNSNKKGAKPYVVYDHSLEKRNYLEREAKANGSK